MADPSILVSEGQMRIKRCIHGLMLYNSRDSFIGRSLDLYGEYSIGEFTFLQDLKQHIYHIRMRLFDFIKEHDRVWPAPYLLS